MTTKYNLEKNLVEDFKSVYLKKNNTNKNSLELLTEIKTSWGIVDVLALHYNKRVLDKRMENIKSYPQFTNLAAYAMVFLERKIKTTYEELAANLQIKNSYLDNLVNLLHTRGLIRLYKNKNIRVCSKSKIFVIRDITAFEAKLANWKKAVNQAERHLWFTNNSFVVIPSITLRRVNMKIKGFCKERGVGLIVQDDNENFLVAVNPPNRGFLESFFCWKLNELIVDRYYNE